MSAKAAMTEKCPACGAEVERPVMETREDGMASCVVVADPGTSWAHLRDEHPGIFAEMCEARRKMNANPYIGGMPRRVDGCFLRDGEDVSDIMERAR